MKEHLFKFIGKKNLKRISAFYEKGISMSRGPFKEATLYFVPIEEYGKINFPEMLKKGDWILTQENPKLREFKEGVSVYWYSSVSKDEKNTIIPTELSTIYHRVYELETAKETRIIAFDCLEKMVLYNSLAHTAKLFESIYGVIQDKNITGIINADKRVFSTTEYHTLIRVANLEEYVQEAQLS